MQPRKTPIPNFYNKEQLKQLPDFSINKLIELIAKKEVALDVSQSEFIEKVISPMIDKAKSIDTSKEKENWKNLLPLMNKEQSEKLIRILFSEKEKIKSIEEKYENKKTEIKKRYLEKWQELGYLD